MAKIKNFNEATSDRYEITIKGEARTDYEDLEELDGVDCQDRFSEYFDTGDSYVDAVSGGYMDFVFEDGKLWTVTKYTSNRELTQDELHDLGDYTQGQWSDGIGEGFEQNPVCVSHGDEEAYISPWFSGQELTITQVKK
jgi:hypothetical protein